jgi:hypothetical protein
MRFRPLLLMVAAVIAGGCSCRVQPAPGPEPMERGPAPEYAEVAARYNERVADVGLIWAQATTRIWYTDEEGRDQSEQADSYLQHIAPNNVLLEITRFGKKYGLLGANDEFYWWILTDDRTAVVGSHEQTTPEAAAQAGLPVHPLDLLALIGAAPLAPESGAGEVWWSEEGHRRLMVASPARWGRIVMALDPDTYEPLAVEMQRGGRPAVSSELGDYMPYERRSNPSDVRMPGAVMIYAHESEARIRMSPYDYHATSRRPNRGVFDLTDLLQRNRIAPENTRRVEDYVRDLSEAPGSAAVGR